MVLTDTTKVEVISLTPAAADAVRDLFAKRELEDYALRVFVQGSGCSGLQYGMALENNFREQDTVVDSNGVNVVVDEVSLQYLAGSTVDFVEDVTGSGFKVENPNAADGCGYGDSYSSESSACGGGSCGC
ncbi:MAG: iron-sulfur cluster insertion protein ErpA [Chloroflexi bacterium]|nr:iron-sulfur cluster insertion protein ErpA [Chloroflexota bacterium]